MASGRDSQVTHFHFPENTAATAAARQLRLTEVGKKNYGQWRRALGLATAECMRRPELERPKDGGKPKARSGSGGNWDLKKLGCLKAHRPTSV